MAKLSKNPQADSTPQEKAENYRDAVLAIHTKDIVSTAKIIISADKAIKN